MYTFEQASNLNNSLVLHPTGIVARFVTGSCLIGPGNDMDIVAYLPHINTKYLHEVYDLVPSNPEEYGDIADAGWRSFKNSTGLNLIACTDTETFDKWGMATDILEALNNLGIYLPKAARTTLFNIVKGE